MLVLICKAVNILTTIKILFKTSYYFENSCSVTPHSSVLVNLCENKTLYMPVFFLKTTYKAGKF